MNKLTTVLLSSLLSVTSIDTFSEEWKFEFTPYAWIAANEGSTGAYGTLPNGNEFESISKVDIPFKDLIDSTEFGTMLNLSAKKGNWLIFSEFTHLKVTDEQASTAGLNGNVEVDIELEITGSILDVMAGYRFIEKQNFNLYAYAGMRYLDLEAGLNVATNFDLLSIDSTIGDDFIDAIVGTHMNWKINEKFTLLGRIEMGGFDDQPKEDLLVSITLDHKVSENWSLKYFYRYMSIDYADNGFVYDMEVSGPGIGASYAF